MASWRGLPACLSVLFVSMVALSSTAQAMDCVAPVVWERTYFPAMDEPGNIDCWRQRYKAQVTIRNATYDILAIVCANDTRYKLLIQGGVGAGYRHLVDLSGAGADHCELVGTDPVYTAQVVAGPSKVNHTRNVFSRANWGEPFVQGMKSLWRSPSWYECGVSIPSSRKVYGHEHGCMEKAVPEDKKTEEVSDVFARLRIALIGAGVLIAVAGVTMAIAYLSIRYGTTDCYKCGAGDEEALHSPPEELPPAESLHPAMTHPLSPLPAADPSAPPPPATHPGQPPQYEHAEKFPLVPATESPPPKYSEQQNHPVLMTSI